MADSKWYKIEFRVTNVPQNCSREYKAGSVEEAITLLKRERQTVEHILAVWERVR